jgi:hypothetical protein
VVGWDADQSATLPWSITKTPSQTSQELKFKDFWLGANLFLNLLPYETRTPGAEQ